MLSAPVSISSVLFSPTEVGRSSRPYHGRNAWYQPNERMRKMLQGWCLTLSSGRHITLGSCSYLQQLDTRIANGDNGEEKNDSVAADSAAAKKKEPSLVWAETEAKFTIKKKDDAAAKVGEDAQNAAAKAHPVGSFAA